MLPKFAMAIDQATQFMRQGISRSSRLFGIEVLNEDPVDRLLAAFFAAVINEEIRQMKLPQIFVGGLKVALITNQAIHKVGGSRPIWPPAPVGIDKRHTIPLNQ